MKKLNLLTSVLATVVLAFILCFSAAFAEGEGDGTPVADGTGTAETTGGTTIGTEEPDAPAADPTTVTEPAADPAAGEGAGVGGEVEYVRVIPSAKDTALATIANVEPESTVTAYRVVGASYGVYGIEDYLPVTDAEIAQIEAPTKAEVLALAVKARHGKFTEKLEFTNVSGTSSFTADLPAGSWIVLVTNKTDATYVYNPFYISAYYTDANEATSLIAGTVDASGNFEIDGHAYYAKRSKIELEKTIQTAEKKSTKFDDYEIGDTADFRVETMIPLYDDVFRHTVTADGQNRTYFYLVDDQSKGLDAATDFVVTTSEDGTAYTEIDAKYYDLQSGILANGVKFDESKLTSDTEPIGAGNLPFEPMSKGNDWILFINPDWVVDHIGNYIRVEYKSVINGDSLLATKANPNDVTLTFTNDIFGNFSHLEDRVRYYTFEVDQAIKIDETESLLAGAEFALIEKGSEQTFDEPLRTATTGGDGKIVFRGLDATTYQMKETKAPANHFLNGTVYDVTIDAVYDDETKEIVSYTVTITDGTGKAVSTIPATGEPDIAVTRIIDPTLSKLPSTGGVGTVLFTIFGLLLIGGCAGFLFYKTRRGARV